MAKQISIDDRFDVLFKRIDHLEDENEKLRNNVDYLTNRLIIYETHKIAVISSTPPFSDMTRIMRPDLLENI